MPNIENEASFVQWKDIKNVQNRTVYSFGLIIQKMRSEVTKLINTVGEQAISAPLCQSNFVSLMILFRIRECMLSIDLLISKGLARDAAVLLLTLIELRFEMEYIALDSLNADEWISQTRSQHRPWEIDFLLKELFQDDLERQAEKENYDHFLQMKYADPMGDQPRFPIKDDDSASASNDDLATCLFCEGSECYRILKAAARDLSDSGFEIQDNKAAIEELYELQENLHSLKQERQTPSKTRFYPGS